VDVEITELEKIDADRVDGVLAPASGIPILLMKGIAEPLEKDWADWDAAHEGGGKASASGDSKASAADAVARAKQTIADHAAGKKVSAADLKNAHEVHEAHLAHEAKLKAATAKPAAAKPAAKPAAKKELAKGARDCPKCGKSYDADHEGGKCENCGTDLPDAPAAKSLPDWHGEAVALVKKAMVRGKVDESADIDGGQQAIALVGKLIGYEAQELAAGNLGEVADIGLLAEAAGLLRQWVSGESAVQDGSVMPATALMQSAAKGTWRDVPDIDTTGWPKADADFFALFKLLTLSKAKHSADDRKKLAEQGNALSDGSYPIADEEDLKSAAILAQSGHGDVDGAKRLIGRRSKELGVKNPLEGSDNDGDASKSQIAPEGTTVDTVTQTGDLTEVVKAAVAKAVEPIEKLRQELEATLAKVKATPVPGGPVLSHNVQVKAPGGIVREDYAAKAAYYREMAETVTDRETADGYRKLAREAGAKAVTPTS